VNHTDEDFDKFLLGQNSVDNKSEHKNGVGEKGQEDGENLCKMNSYGWLLKPKEEEPVPVFGLEKDSLIDSESFHL